MHDGALVIGHERQAVPVKQPLEAVTQAVAHFSRDLAGVRALDLTDGRVPGEAGQRIGRQCAADIRPVLACGKTGRHELRVFLLAADAARRRVPACDDLAEDRQIRHDAEIALRARKRNAEARDDLVEDHQRAVFVAQRPHACVIVVRNGPRAALGADRLDNDARCAAEQHVALEHILQHGQIVRPHLVRRLIAAAGDAVRFQKRPAAGDFQTVDHLVGPTVIRAADLDDALFARRNARDAKRRHDGLRAAAEHTEHFNVRHMLIDLFCDHQLRFVEQTRHRAALVQQFNHLFPDDGIVAAENCRAAGL